MVRLIRWAHSTLNIQFCCGHVRLIVIEYYMVGLIRWAHSTYNIQSCCGHVRLIGIEYYMVGLIRWLLICIAIVDMLGYFQFNIKWSD
jgi:hypothetical protein